MKNALFACATHRGMSRETTSCISDCKVPLLTQSGITGVGMARNVTLASVLEAALESDVDTVVMVDDDMVFTPETVQTLVDLSRQWLTPASAIYMTGDEKIAAMPYGDPSDDWLAARWLVGLGLVAIPTARLADLRARSTVSVMGVPSYTWEGPCDRHSWLGVDYRLFERMGGAIMAPVLAGHVKPTIIIPHTDLLDKLTTTGGFE